MGVKSVSKKRAAKLVKKGKATKSGKNEIEIYKRKARKNPDAWVKPEDVRTKKVRAGKSPKKGATAKTKKKAVRATRRVDKKTARKS